MPLWKNVGHVNLSHFWYSLSLTFNILNFEKKDIVIILCKSIPTGEKNFIQACKVFNWIFAEINNSYWSSWYKRFLGDLQGILIGKVTLFISEFLLITLFRSNIVGTGFIFIAKTKSIAKLFDKIILSFFFLSSSSLGKESTVLLSLPVQFGRQFTMQYL